MSRPVSGQFGNKHRIYISFLLACDILCIARFLEKRRQDAPKMGVRIEYFPIFSNLPIQAIDKRLFV